ncbi:MAG: LysR family transcriptional regulator [Burkholderiales bacterium]|nr:LysR family transcriptional regulator [Burkholderiales bacterium]
MKSTRRARTTLEVSPVVLPDAGALEFFARVAASGSFAAAARQLGLTRAAISRRVAHVERQAGVALFLRSTRSLGLTEAGRRLQGRARAVLEAAEVARRDLRSRGAAAGAGGADAPLAGTLRLTSVPLFGQTVLAPLLAAFQARHPALRIEMRFTARRIDLLREDVDLAFRLTERPPEDCVAQAVLSYVVRAYAAPRPGLPLAGPAALAGQRCLLLGPPTTEEATLHWRAEAGDARATLTIQPAMLADDLGSLQAVARAGGGIVFAPDFCAADDLARGALVDALPGWRLPVPEGEAVMAITLPWTVAPASARALVAFVRESLAERACTAA